MIRNHIFQRGYKNGYKNTSEKVSDYNSIANVTTRLSLDGIR